LPLLNAEKISLDLLLLIINGGNRMRITKRFPFSFLFLIITIILLFKCKIYEVEITPQVNPSHVQKLEKWDLDSTYNLWDRYLYKHHDKPKTLVFKFHEKENVELDLKIVKQVFDQTIPVGNTPVGTDMTSAGGNADWSKSIVVDEIKESIPRNIFIYKIPDEFTAGIYGVHGTLYYSYNSSFTCSMFWFELEEDYLD
jgi:hypothetical protein